MISITDTDNMSEVEVIMERFGSTRKRSDHNLKICDDDMLHFCCNHYDCPNYNKEKKHCNSIVLDNTMRTKHCFCG